MIVSLAKGYNNPIGKDIFVKENPTGRKAEQPWALAALQELQLLWLDHLKALEDKSQSECKSTLKKITLATPFIADASKDAKKFSARAVSAVARYHTWIHACTGNAHSKTNPELIQIPRLLVGEKLDKRGRHHTKLRQSLPSLHSAQWKDYKPNKRLSIVITEVPQERQHVYQRKTLGAGSKTWFGSNTFKSSLWQQKTASSPILI